ncbi:hypothetical protein RF11_06883 [Thelohanellus kitauei]|uniref:Transglutaminase-like domain-containing protein n=1 Tax=Thelohanellus kitauei TaxID=669202 RepID=A0A0C2MKW2_THEKT|nr:hypothetical protein RF11_06883 [Thelohanellus kitauei]
MVHDLTILFNPYLKEDQTFLHTKENCIKYLESQTMMFYPDSDKISGSDSYSFDQFSNDSLKVTAKLLNNLKFEKRSDAIQVMRLFSQWVNSDGRNGIILGKWDMKPTHLCYFHSVNKCLTDYSINLSGPVCHGQCSVLNITMCCLLRSIGIGCRIVTGKSILHIPSLVYPISQSRCLEIKLFDVEQYYHVWSNAFCRRDVLQDDKRLQDGWQFLDSTPYNIDKGFTPFGPFPLKCLMNENISEIQYDGPMVKHTMKNYILIFDSIIEGTEYKSIFLKGEEKMLTQGLDRYQIEDVTKEHQCRIPDYFETMDKSINICIQAERNIRFKSTIDIIISFTAHTSPSKKMFIVGITADRHKPSCIRNIIYYNETSNKSHLDYKINFSINPYNKLWYSINPVHIKSRERNNYDLCVVKICLCRRNTTLAATIRRNIKAVPVIVHPQNSKQFLKAVFQVFKLPNLFEASEIVEKDAFHANSAVAYKNDMNGKFSRDGQRKTDVLYTHSAHSRCKSITLSDIPKIIIKILKDTLEKRLENIIFDMDESSNKQQSFFKNISNMNETEIKANFSISHKLYSPSKLSQIIIKCNKLKNDSESLNLHLKAQMRDDKVEVILTPNVHAAVGFYQFKLFYERSFIMKGDLTILFNPYSKDDPTYLNNEENLKKYLEFQKMVNYPFSERRSSIVPYSFNQYSVESLHVVTKILNTLRFEKRSDPIQVMRLFSKWVNSDGCDGIIFGKCDDTPCQFTRFESVNKCLRDYSIVKSGPVCHGQCYELNVTMCCLLRSIGIGCRIVIGRNILRNPSLESPIRPLRWLDVKIFDNKKFL